LSDTYVVVAAFAATTVNPTEATTPARASAPSDNAVFLRVLGFEIRFLALKGIVVLSNAVVITGGAVGATNDYYKMY
jgi:hypothetical protein